MRVHLLYFGVLKDVLGRDRAVWDLAEGQTVGELVRLVEESASKDSMVWQTLAVAVNLEYVGAETILREGDEVALLPPVSGGREEERL